MSAAFDSINHALMIQKLRQLDLPSGFVNWLCSYLSDRRCVVKIQNHFSRPVQVKIRVPQGSVLGPALFSIFIADLQCMNPATVQVQYADDISLVLPISSSNDLPVTDNLSDEISNTENWCTRVIPKVRAR